MENKEFDNLVDLIKKMRDTIYYLTLYSESFVYNILLNSEKNEILFKKYIPFIEYYHSNTDTDKVFRITKIYLEIDNNNKINVCLWRRDTGDITIDYGQIRPSDLSDVIFSIGSELGIKYSKE